MLHAKSLRAAAFLMLAALCPATALSAESGDAKPNILFLAVDDLRPELGCYGRSSIQSPNIDRLAQSGLVFQRAYCQQAVCSPSRTSLLTGLRPDSTQVYDLVTRFRDTVPDVVTLPQHFKNHGYRAVGMGKIYHGGLDDAQSWSMPWRRPTASTYRLPENQKLVEAKRVAARQKGLKAKALSRAARGPATEAADVPDNAYHDGALADMAVRTLQRMSEHDKPFFLAVGFIRPHLPFVAPQKYWDLYDPQQIELADNPFAPKGAPPCALTSWGELRVYEGTPQQGPVSDQLARELIHGYRACVSYMDAQVGRILGELERLGLRENTIVILWGDHGWKLGEHGAWCKHTNFELDARVPLIISAPGQATAGKSSDALVEFVDIYPTLAELAGLPLPAHLEGTSFVPLMENPQRGWKSAAFSQYPRSLSGQRLMGYSMRTDRYRFTQWVNRKNVQEVIATELYDHQKDPDENTNLAAGDRHEELVRDLAKKLQRGWRAAAPAQQQRGS